MMAEILDPYEERKKALEEQKKAFEKEKEDLEKRNAAAEAKKQEEKVQAKLAGTQATVKSTVKATEDATKSEIKSYTNNRVTNIELDVADRITAGTGSASKGMTDAYMDRAKDRGPESMLATAQANAEATRYTLEAEKCVQDATLSVMDQIVHGTTAENKGKTKAEIDEAVAASIRGFKTAVYNEPDLMTFAVNDAASKIANSYNSILSKEYNKYDKKIDGIDQNLGRITQTDFAAKLDEKSVSGTNKAINKATNSLTNLSTSRYGKYILPPGEANILNTQIQTQTMAITKNIAGNLFVSTQGSAITVKKQVINIQEKIADAQKALREKQQMILNKIKAITDQIKAKVKEFTDKLKDEIVKTLKINW